MTAIPRRLHKVVIKVSSEYGCPPYWWEIPQQGTEIPVDWKVARAIIVGIARMKDYTRDELGMNTYAWQQARAVWDGFSAFERRVYTDISGMQGEAFRDFIKTEDC